MQAKLFADVYMANVVGFPLLRASNKEELAEATQKIIDGLKVRASWSCERPYGGLPFNCGCLLCSVDVKLSCGLASLFCVIKMNVCDATGGRSVFADPRH